jgi:hypothetical protein
MEASRLGKTATVKALIDEGATVDLECEVSNIALMAKVCVSGTELCYL